MIKSIFEFIYDYRLTFVILLTAIFLIAKKFFIQLAVSFANHIFNKQIESFKSELQEKRQEQQHFYNLIMHTLSQENREILSRKAKAIDDIWQSLLSMKKFSTAVKFLGTLN